MTDVVLETERLLLRPLRVEDATVQRALWTERDPRVPPHRRVGADGRPTIQDIEAWIRRGVPPGRLGLLAVQEKAGGRVVGYCGLVPSSVHDAADNEEELAYELLRAAWGHGYATEASRAVLECARESGRRRLWATVRDWNTASFRVLAKLGFAETGDVEADSVHGDSVLLMKTL